MIDIDKYIHTIGRWFFVFFYTYQSILRMFDFSYRITQGMNALIIWTSIIMIHVTAVSHHKLKNLFLCQLSEDLFISEH